MIVTNLIIQLLVVQVQYTNMGLSVKLKEALICLVFLRPIVDVYRVSVSHEDDHHTP